MNCFANISPEIAPAWPAKSRSATVLNDGEMCATFRIDKGKLCENRGRKAAGLRLNAKAAGLPGVSERGTRLISPCFALKVRRISLILMNSSSTAPCTIIDGVVMPIDFCTRALPARIFIGLALLLAVMFSPAEALAATKYASPDGSSFASGNQPNRAWNPESCMTRLSPGDTCIYLEGVYADVKFVPEDSGTRNARITHRCEVQHGCVFDRLIFDGVSYLDIVNIASDSNYYNSKMSSANPRMAVFNSHDLRFDSIRVRGERNQCAPGNPGPGCSNDSPYNRYNDLVEIGSPAPSARPSWNIEILGRSVFIDGNHTVMQIHGDGNGRHCEDTESNIWIHGTPQQPIVFSNAFHHLISFKGACSVLVEYADFGPAGSGRGDLAQPVRGTYDQAGSSIHGSTMRKVIVRYSNFANGGAGTNAERNKSHILVGVFGSEVNGACFPHNSHYRPWGTFASLGRLNNVKSVRNVSILNNAIQEGWYLQRDKARSADSDYAGFLISRAGMADNVSVDIDGIVSDNISAPKGLITTGSEQSPGFSAGAFNFRGISVGPKVSKSQNGLFRGPANWDFRPAIGSRLEGSAAPIARTMSSGTGTSIKVDRPECFAGTLGGMRSGDRIQVGNAQCSVVDNNLANGTVQCRERISWTLGDEIYYVNDGSPFRDIGSRRSTSPPPSVERGPDATPKPPVLISED